MNKEDLPEIIDISSQIGNQAASANIEQGKAVEEKIAKKAQQNASEAPQPRERSQSPEELKEVVEATRERFLNIFKGQHNIKSVVVMTKKPFKRDKFYTVKVTRKYVTHISGPKSNPTTIEYALDDGAITLNKQVQDDEFREQFYDTLNEIGQAIDANKAEVFEERGRV